MLPPPFTRFIATTATAAAIVAATLSHGPLARADGPADNVAEKVRRIPPVGIAIPDDVRRELSQGVARLGTELESARAAFAQKPDRLALLPDIQIYHKAVDWALRYDEVFRTNEIAAAKSQLQTASDRLAALQEGKAPWSEATGPIARGYRSQIDDSIQPYGLVVPASYKGNSGKKWRLDFWFHGRGEQLSELSFIADRSKNLGEFSPPDTFVLHLYGRYCNGSRFAGETDFWEALAEVQRRYPIDENRLVVRGFSLGGAACWHLTTHFASHWAAAAPGAGFSETAEFLNVFQNEKLQPTAWEQKLWRMYDSTSHALNTTMVPLVAYSGEIDGQRQAARAMEKAMATEGLTLTHLIGPKTGHSYEKTTKVELNRRIDALAAHGRDPVPREVHFVTHTLRYNQMAWVTVDALGEHWEPARVNGWQSASDNRIELTTTNVTALTLRFDSGEAGFEVFHGVSVKLDGNTLVGPAPGSDRSWSASFHREGAGWKLGALPSGELRKEHGLQGPIDDAFMDSFLFVRPTGSAMNSTVEVWAKAEFERAVEQWRCQFRGDARVKDDTAVTDADLAAHNVVLWGDPKSNALLGRLADRLPIRWTTEGVQVGTDHFPAANHVAELVYPNPLNPHRYVVVNSSFTFREYDYLNNARQTSKLPDWAVVDITTPPGSRWPGRIAAAGFFGERWELK